MGMKYPSTRPMAAGYGLNRDDLWCRAVLGAPPQKFENAR
jgi:hypothetical protein